MSGFSTLNTDHLIRSNLWSSDLKEVLEDELMAQKYVKMITEFPDGDTLNIPSIGQMEAQDYQEGDAIRYTAMDTGNFTFTIDQYKASATYITNKMKQDSYLMSQLVSSFVPKQARALAKAMETKILRVGPEAQTATDANVINEARHRWVASGPSETLAFEDFAKAGYALFKANVPMSNMVAIIDPTAWHTLATQTNVVNLLTPNPQWGNMVSEGSLTGMSFKAHIYGFDVYVSQNLKRLAASEAIEGVTAAVGVCNIFFSAASDLMPIVGHVRQAPTVESEYNKDLQRDEYLTVCRYGYKLFRPENFVTVISDTDQVYA